MGAGGKVLDIFRIMPFSSWRKAHCGIETMLPKGYFIYLLKKGRV